MIESEKFTATFAEDNAGVTGENPHYTVFIDGRR
jgi:hypothetical protein